MAGGLLGQVAAFLYCIGFYHIVVISNENVKIVAMIAFLLTIIIITGNTLLPRWAFLCSPLCLMSLKSIIARLPKGIRIIISGGWSNLISVIYYGVAIVCMLR